MDTLLLLFLALPLSNLQARQRDTLGTGSRIYFVQNLGQWDSPFLFKAEMNRAAFFAESDRFTFVIKSTPSDETGHPHHHGGPAHAYRVLFEGCNTHPTVSGQDISPEEGYDNYFLGNQPHRWVTHVPHHKTILYQNLYPGIDMDVRVAQHALKNNFYISPGANPALITMRYEGIDKLYLSSGNLIIRTSVGEIVELSPYAYQDCDTGQCEVDVRFRVQGNRVSFLVGDYNPTLPLVIDPVLHFSTYTGSSADNWGTTATFDYKKCTYTSGLVFATGYPVSTGSYDQSFNGNGDIGIFKFDSTGSQRIFATYLGGSYADMPHSMIVNSFNELVIFGTTGSRDFPTTPQAYDTSFNGGTVLHYEGGDYVNYPNGSDIFVSRFSSDGTQLQASTYIGGSGNDGLNYRNYYSYLNIMCGNDSLYFNYGDGARGEIITDDLNNIYIGSTTFSYNFPVTVGSVNIYPPLNQNGVVLKLDYNLRNIIWSTYLGGDGDDAVYSIDVDSSYNVIVCGGTNSTNFPTSPGAYQSTYGGGTADGFITKISYTGDHIISSTYYGSEAYDQIYFVRTGKHDEVFIYGQTKATGNTMIYNANYNTPGAGNLLTRFHPDLTGRVWSTVFGTPLGHPNLSPTAFAADICNRVYAVGWGRDFVGSCVSDFAHGSCHGMETTPDAFQSTTDGQDFYILSIDNTASHLDYATFFGESYNDDHHGGGDHVDGGTSRLDRRSTLYQSVCASCHGANAFPTTPNVWSDNNGSTLCNNAVFRFTVHTDFPVAECIVPPVGCAPYTVNFQNTGRGDSFQWDFGDGTTSTAANPTHTYTAAGNYTVRLIAFLQDGCKPSDTTHIKICVLNPNQGQHLLFQPCEGELTQIGHQPMLGCSYQWLSGSVSDSTVANPYVTQSGIYILRITSLDSSCSQTDTFEVRFNDIPATLEVHNPTCPGYADGYALAHVPQNLLGRVQLLWDGQPGDTLLSSLSADGRQHLLTIIMGNCTNTHAFTIVDPPTLVYTIEADSILCGSDCDGWIRLTYGYPGGPTTDSLIENLCEGLHTVAFADSAGCPYSASTTIKRDTLLNHMSVWADSYEIFLSQSVGLHVTPLPGATYSWTDPSTLSQSFSPNPVATPNDSVTYYECTVVDSLGCSWRGGLSIHCTEVDCGAPNIFIPNTFSPNDDGINDRLTFKGKWVLEFHLAIYSRWGEKVYETNDINDSWDGRYNGNWCLPGVYSYYCRIKCEAGQQNLLKGDITLIR